MAKKDWKKRESLPSAMIQVAVTTVVLAGGVLFYVQRGQHKKEVADRLKEAKASALKDNPADLQKALAGAQAILENEPNSPYAVAFAADVETELWLVHKVPGADAKAREFSDRAESLNSTSEDRYAAKILQFIAEGKPAEAEAYGEELRKRGASSPKLWYGLAEAFRAQGNMDLERQSFQQATDKAWKNPRFFAAYAEALIDEGLIDQAIEVANKGIADNPDHIQARLALATARTKKRDHVKDAADTVRDVLSQPDLTPGLKLRALVTQAFVFNFEQRYDDAIASANKALAMDPAAYTALWAKANAQALKKDSGALATYKAAVAARKTATGIYLEGAQLLQQAGNSDGALALLGTYEDAFKAINIQTTDGKMVPWLDRDDRYWLARGDVARAAAKFDAALAAYDKAITARGLHLSQAHYARGAVFLAKKDYEKASAEFKAVAPEDGTGMIADAYLGLGEILFSQKDYPTGCQNYAFALARLKTQQAPRERMNGILEDVNRRLVAAGQGSVAKLWMKEARPIIQ